MDFLLICPPSPAPVLLSPGWPQTPSSSPVDRHTNHKHRLTPVLRIHDSDIQPNLFQTRFPVYFEYYSYSQRMKTHRYGLLIEAGKHTGNRFREKLKLASGGKYNMHWWAGGLLKCRSFHMSATAKVTFSTEWELVTWQFNNGTLKK